MATATPEVARRLERLLKKKKIQETFRLLRLASGKTRYRILCLLKEYAPGLTVNQISDILEETQSLVSHQLRDLRKHGVVETRRNGREVIYSLTSRRLRQLLMC